MDGSAKVKKTVPRIYTQVARAKATDELKAEILSAFSKELLSKWFDDITLDDVARSASTTRQTVIRFYGNKNGLLAAATALINERMGTARTREVQSAEELAADFVARMEKFGDGFYRIATTAARNPEMQPSIIYGRQQHRIEMRAAIAPWLKMLSAAQAERILNQCLVITDTYTWVLLRREYGLGPEETIATVADMLHKILGDTPRKAKPSKTALKDK